MSRSTTLYNISTYTPLNDGEYMSDDMLSYFQNILETRLAELAAKQPLSDSSSAHATAKVDQTEKTIYSDVSLQSHHNHLSAEIKSALVRIEEGAYGYCDETGEPIGVRRLLAMPTARYCIKVQQLRENRRVNPNVFYVRTESAARCWVN